MSGERTVHWADLYCTSWRIGFFRAMHLPPFFMEKMALARLLVPMDICRFYELPKVGGAVLKSGARRVLDVSSPKLLALELARRGVEVVAIDAWEKEIVSWRRLVDRAGTGAMFDGRLHWAVMDGRTLSFPDETFDAAYAISSIEHIPEGGDITALQELRRVVRRGGEIYLTVPYGVEAEEQYRAESVYAGGRATERGIFYMWVYDDRALEERFIRTRGLTLLEREPCADVFPFIEMELNARLLPFSAAWGNFHPLIHYMVHRPGRIPRKG